MKKTILLLLISSFFFVAAAPAPKEDEAAYYYATLIINVPNANGSDIRDSLCQYWGYTGNPADNTAKMEYIRVRVAAFVKNEYVTAKSVIAGDAARNEARVIAEQVDIN